MKSKISHHTITVHHTVHHVHVIGGKNTPPAAGQGTGKAAPVLFNDPIKLRAVLHSVGMLAALGLHLYFDKKRP